MYRIYLNFKHFEKTYLNYCFSIIQILQNVKKCINYIGVSNYLNSKYNRQYCTYKNIHILKSYSSAYDRNNDKNI